MHIEWIRNRRINMWNQKVKWWNQKLESNQLERKASVWYNFEKIKNRIQYYSDAKWRQLYETIIESR